MHRSMVLKYPYLNVISVIDKLPSERSSTAQANRPNQIYSPIEYPVIELNNF
jgi:hypothetical protein